MHKPLSIYDPPLAISREIESVMNEFRYGSNNSFRPRLLGTLRILNLGSAAFRIRRILFLRNDPPKSRAHTARNNACLRRRHVVQIKYWDFFAGLIFEAAAFVEAVRCF